jgi:hypothetical protein
MSANIVDFYLGTPLLRVHVKYNPEDVLKKYDAHRLIKDNHVMAEIFKGIYRLPQAGILAQDRLVAHLEQHGYRQAKNTRVFHSRDAINLSHTGSG